MGELKQTDAEMRDTTHVYMGLTQETQQRLRRSTYRTKLEAFAGGEERPDDVIPNIGWQPVEETRAGIYCKPLWRSLHAVGLFCTRSCA